MRTITLDNEFAYSGEKAVVSQEATCNNRDAAITLDSVTGRADIFP